MSPSCLRLAASFTTSHRTGWLLLPDGALVAASTIFNSAASETSRLGSSRRMARVVVMASKTSMAAVPSAADGLEAHHGDLALGALLVGVVPAPGRPGQVPEPRPLIVLNGQRRHRHAA